MSTYDLDRMFGEWVESADSIAEPQTLLPSVFAVTRTAPQRRGFVGRVRLTLNGSDVSSRLRPVMTYALLILLLLALTFAFAFSAGLLKPRPPTGWRMVDTEFPERTYISEVTAMPAGGFMAIGSSDEVTSDCGEGQQVGRVWTSADGDVWTDQSSGWDRKLQQQGLFTTNEWIYLIGTDLVCYDGTGAGPDPQVHILRSRDGVGWEELPEPEDVFRWGNVPHVSEVDGELVAIGTSAEALPSGEFGQDVPTVWSSPDGKTWRRLATLPGISYVLGFAARDGVMVAIGGVIDQPRIVILTSADGGTTWDPQELPDGVPSSVSFLVAADGRFVAAGDDAAIVSADGRTWTAADASDGTLNGVTDLLAVPDGYLVVRTDRADKALRDVCQQVAPPIAVPSISSQVEFTPNPSPVMTCVPEPVGGGTSFSRDGVNWSIGPDLPTSVNTAAGNSYTVAVGEDGLIALESSHLAEIWYSPLEPFTTSD